MDNYTLDFGKLAYSKTEDLSKRIVSLESKIYNNYNSINFKTEDITITTEVQKTEVFIAEKNTDINFTYKLNGSGQFEISVYLNEVFVFSEDITLTADKSFEFEAKGVESGEKILKTIIVGSGTLELLQITINGQNISYSDTIGQINTTAISGIDYVLELSNQQMKLFNYNGINLNSIKTQFEKIEYCKIINHLENGFLLLFYTVWDNTLYYEMFDIALNKSTVKEMVFYNVTTFTVCTILDEIWLYFISDKKCYFSSASLINGKLCFIEPVILNVANAKELEAKSNNAKVYLIYADINKNSKLLYTPTNINTQKENFSFLVSVNLEDG